MEPESSSPTTLQPDIFLSPKPDVSNPGPPIPIL
jgi:hypothetical protein